MMSYFTRNTTLTKMDLLKFSQTLELNIQEEIENAYPFEWSEDYLSLRLAKALRELSYSQVEYINQRNNVLIIPFKLKGTNENKFGDIAIIMDIEFKDGDKLKGVAFLEAKMMYDNSNEYGALKKDQLERIYSNAPNSRLLLYNYNHMSTLAPSGLGTSKVTGGSSLLPKFPVTYCSVLPVNTALELKQKNDRLHKASIPLSYQFSFRYLFGMDLEFDQDKIQSAQGYLQEKYGVPSYVVAVSVKPGKKGEKEIDAFYQPEINRELYAEIINNK